MKYLFIAEKPSLMRDVKACYDNHRSELNSKVGQIDFRALSGHVCAFLNPDEYPAWSDTKWQDIDYPMIPMTWGIRPIDDARKKKTIAEIKKIAPSYDGIIVGTDSDVEGYGIYYLLEHYLHLEKKKALRFIEHSLTDGEILKSLLTMTDFHEDPVHVRFTQSYLVRAQTDWLYNLNATRMVTIKEDQLMNIGRVKSPTIRLIYDNSMAIENFKPRKYFVAVADYGSFTSTLIGEDGTICQFEKITDIPEFPKEGVVKKKECKRTYEHAPKLFDLTAVQAEAGRTLGLSPSQTLEAIQSLYEKHKVISYPRTQCRYVSIKTISRNAHILYMGVFL